MATVNYNEVKLRLRGLSMKQLETLRGMVDDRIDELVDGAKIEPYRKEWATSPGFPSQKQKSSPIGNPQTREGSLLDDDDVPF